MTILCPSPFEGGDGGGLTTMAKYTPMDLLKSLHGKVCGHSDIYFAQRGSTLYTGKICATRTTPPNENELAIRSKFATVRKAVLALSSQEQAAYAAAYKKNPQGYKTLYGYTFAQEYKKTA